MDDEKYSRMEGLVKEFEAGVGPRLQKYLVLKSWWTTNYVSNFLSAFIRPVQFFCQYILSKPFKKI